MGREHEIIDAGRTGNLSVIEKMFSQRGKKSAALVSQITGAFARHVIIIDLFSNSMLSFIKYTSDFLNVIK